jgi:hypothetical protein
MHTLRLGLPGQLNELLRDWFGTYGLSIGERPLREAEQVATGDEIMQPDTPDLYGGIMETVGWFVVAMVATVGAGISGGGGTALLAAGPVGWVVGAIISAIVAFLAVRYGTARAKEVANTWHAPTWVARNILTSSRIARMRGDFQRRLRETLGRETAGLQDELEVRIRELTERQIEGLSEVTQL